MFSTFENTPILSIAMKRVQLFEFEDLTWFPNWIRKCMTNLLVVINRMMGVSSVLAKLIANISKEKPITRIVDLGSGAGGAMPETQKILAEKYNLKNIQLTLTDLYPNESSIKKFNQKNEPLLTYAEESVDATQLDQGPKGLKTMINCFHHMPPKQARSILSSAARSNEPILIYELTENKMPIVLWWLLLPLSLVFLMVSTLFLTPFVKQITWQQIVFTYLIPIIPIFYAWDGQASMPRMYTFEDLDELLQGLETDSYKWEKGFAYDENEKKSGTYLLGMPI